MILVAREHLHCCRRDAGAVSKLDLAPRGERQNCFAPAGALFSPWCNPGGSLRSPPAIYFMPLRGKFGDSLAAPRTPSLDCLVQSNLSPYSPDDHIQNACGIRRDAGAPRIISSHCSEPNFCRTPALRRRANLARTSASRALHIEAGQPLPISSPPRG